MRKSGVRYIVCIVLYVLFLGTSTAQKVIRIEQPAYLFERAQQMLREGNYAGCIDLMTQYRKQATDFSDKATADYLIIAASYAAKASCTLEQIENYLATYPATPYYGQIQLLQGHLYFEQGDYSKAIEIYQAIRMESLSDDDQAELLLHLGSAFLETGQEDKAGPCFSAIIQVGGEHKNAALYRDAYRNYKKEEYAEAEKQLTQITGDKNFAKPATALLAQTLFAQEKYTQAIQVAGQYVENYSADSTYYEMESILGESYFRTENYKQAISFLSPYITKCTHPKRSSYYALGMSYYVLGNYTEAIQQLGETTGEKDTISQSAYLFIGQSYLQLNDKTNAQLAFEMASRDNFDIHVQEVALYNYALTLKNTTFSPFAKAVTIFEKFLNLFPQSQYTDAINNYLVDVYMTTRNYSTALNSINKIQHPTNKILKAKQRILYRLGTERFANNDLNGAIKYFTQSINVGNYDREAKAEAYLWLGDCLYQQEHYPEAIKNGLQYLKIASPINSLVYYNLGYAYFKQQDFVKAQTQLSRYVTQTASSDANQTRIADANTRIADCLYAQRRFAEAETTYDTAVSLYPPTGDYALFQKGFMAGLQKKYTEKIGALQQLQKQYPQSEYMDKALLEEGLTHIILQDGQAVDCFTSLLNQYPDKESARKAGLQLGMLYYNEKQPQKAIETYKNLIADYPSTEEAHIALQDLKAVYVDQNDVQSYASYLKTIKGNVSAEISELDSLTFLTAERAFLKNPDTSSAAQLEQYLKKYPKGSYTLPAHNYLGLYYYDKKNYTKARKELEIVLKQPNTPYTEEALIRLADIQEQNKEYPAAFASYQKLERLAQQKESLQNARLGMLRTARQWGNHKEVINVSEKLLNTPTLSLEHIRTVRTARAESFLALGDSAKAAIEWDKLSEDPRTEIGAKSAYLLAQYYFDRGDDTQAESVVNRLLENGTSHQYWLARSFILLSEIYARQGDYFKAKQYLLSLQNNYTAEDDIQKQVDALLEKFENMDAQ
ncbi:MAG: tetratricopeptide repeat protein [Porphyromonadaceae bacterium]|nr:tetratricopeptide repeat protein [Porphyromonadaceae bacterium]